MSNDDIDHLATENEYLSIGGMYQNQDGLFVPVTIKQYPKGFNELIASVKSNDSELPGMVTMSAVEAEGGEYTETVTDAKSLTFKVPPGYSIEKLNEIAVGLRFRRRNERRDSGHMHFILDMPKDSA